MSNASYYAKKYQIRDMFDVFSIPNTVLVMNKSTFGNLMIMGLNSVKIKLGQSGASRSFVGHLYPSDLLGCTLEITRFNGDDKSDPICSQL